MLLPIFSNSATIGSRVLVCGLSLTEVVLKNLKHGVECSATAKTKHFCLLLHLRILGHDFVQEVQKLCLCLTEQVEGGNERSKAFAK